MICLENKKLHLEIMRIIAIFFVLFNHTGIKGFFLFSEYNPESLRYWIYLFFSVFCKLSVPLFFAISGALLLSKNESVKIIFQKRIFKILIVLFVFSFFNYLQQIYFGNEVFSLKRFLLVLYTKHWNYSYWYLYSYIAFLLSLPFLRALVKELETKFFIYMIFLVGIFNGVLPILDFLFWNGGNTFNNYLKVSWLTSTIVFCPCVGYFLENRMPIVELKNLVHLWGINIITILISCFMTCYHTKITGLCTESTSQVFHNSFVVINLITVYCTIKYMTYSVRFDEKINKILMSLGSNTFGVYLWHIMLMRSSFMWKFFDYMRSSFCIDKMAIAFIYCLIVLLICNFVTLLAKKIPIIGKVI